VHFGIFYRVVVFHRELLFVAQVSRVEVEGLGRQELIPRVEKVTRVALVIGALTVVLATKAKKVYQIVQMMHCRRLYHMLLCVLSIV